MSYGKRSYDKKVYIPVGSFDKKLFSILPAGRDPNGGEGIQSSICYDGSTNVHLVLPGQNISGIQECYNYLLKDPSQKTPDKLEGYQVIYPLTSAETVSKPTADEQYIKDVFDFLQEQAWLAAVKECSIDEDNRIVPAAAAYSYLAATHGKSQPNKNNMVKPLYTRPNIPLKDGEPVPKIRQKDENKSYISYLKLHTWGKGDQLIVKADIRGPGNKVVSPAKYKKVYCYSQIVVKLAKLYWGPHGKSPYGVSLTMKISEMNIAILRKEKKVERFLPPLSVEEYGEESDDEELTGFHNPKEVPDDIFSSNPNIIEDIENNNKEEFPADTFEEEIPSIEEEPPKVATTKVSSKEESKKKEKRSRRK